MFTYAKRLVRITAFLVRGTVDWNNLKLSLRPGQVSVLDTKNRMVFCDAATERMAFHE